VKDVYVFIQLMPLDFDVNETSKRKEKLVLDVQNLLPIPEL